MCLCGFWKKKHREPVSGYRQNSNIIFMSVRERFFIHEVVGMFFSLLVKTKEAERCCIVYCQILDEA